MIFKRITLLLFILLSFSCKKGSVPKPQQPLEDKPIVPEDARWKQVADITMPNRLSILSFSVGDKGYVIGHGEYYGELPSFWEYDSNGDKWTKKASYPGVGKDHLVGFTVGGKAYIGLGFNDPSLSAVLTTEFYEYDPSTDRWTKKADFPGEVRTSSVAFTTQGNGYIGLGGTKIKEYSDLWKYNAANDSWSKVADYPGKGKSLCISFSGSTKAYVGMGTYASNNEVVNNDFWEYDATTNKWTQKANFIGVTRVMGVNFALDDQPYVGLGWARNEAPRDVWKYDVVDDRWLQTSKYPDTYSIETIGFVIGNNVYVGGGLVYNGSSTTITKHLWKFTP